MSKMNNKNLTPGTRVVITRAEKRYGEIDQVLFGRIATIQGQYWGDDRGTSYRVIVDSLPGDDWSLWSDDIDGVLVE